MEKIRFAILNSLAMIEGHPQEKANFLMAIGQLVQDQLNLLQSRHSDVFGEILEATPLTPIEEEHAPQETQES